MSGNKVKINNNNHLEWYISDQHIPAVVTFLESIGSRGANKPMTSNKKKRKNRSLKSKTKFVTN